ncbi:proteasome subunit alpha [bacterium BMS3Bbin02]|nr:proteasome subunit alpha [bacterium BMS3Bbin02]
MNMPMYVPPEQLVKDRAEFAMKGIGRGRPIAAIQYDNGVLLFGENPSATLHKIGEIYDRIAFAAVGRFNEFESLRVAGVRYADVKGYNYGRTDVTARGLANGYAQTLGQIFIHEVKPYEVAVVIVEVGDSADEDVMYRVQFDGTLIDIQSFTALGGSEEALVEALTESYQAGATLADAISRTAAAIVTVEESAVAPERWEAAVLDRTLGRRRFRRLDTQEIVAAIGE